MRDSRAAGHRQLDELTRVAIDNTARSGKHAGTRRESVGIVLP